MPRPAKMAALCGDSAQGASRNDASDDRRAGGCNRVFGGFAFDGDKRHFGEMAAARTACPEGMEQERGFLDAFGKAAALA